ncbi:unnamed protein product [Mytilus edulis]|uniref:Uncharacterized protein n=1 Tax=Mytilus edulis TaxID=6550 RepID=A0A8S3RVQ1_MYTED|nr:unnamed protein product [Mytilus edulis]
MNGFKLYVSNTSTIPPFGYDLCYQDPAGVPAITQTISCNQLGQYVIYYDDVPASRESGSIIELCYVVINGCQTNFWGKDCNMSCTESCIDQHCYPGNGSCILGCNSENCLSGVCDKNTAVCTKGCKERRTGYFCNKYNLAYDGVISQIPSGSQPANLANDGNQTTCSKTVGKNVRLQVDMKEILIVTELHLTSKVHTTVNGLVHKIYASNQSDNVENETILYQGEILPRHISVYSVLRYLTYIVSIQSAKVELEICEIGIVGCPSTKYGPLCNKACPENCHGPCDLETGRCLFGCSNGWIGETCKQACTSGFYGSKCLQNCSINCIQSSCVHTTGECIDGCNSGWTGFNCTQVRSDLQTEMNGTAIGGSIGAVIAVILIIVAGFVIYKKLLVDRKNKTNDGDKYVNAAVTSDLGDVTVYLNDTEHAELPTESDDIVYNNIPTKRSVYRIPIGNLKEVIDIKLKDEGFKKNMSAGVGRTGTFIAIDALYQQGKKVGYVDIMEYVQIMRKDRMNMIQTHEQYETVFEALLELFTIPNSSIPKNDFCKYIADQECKTLPKNQKVYKREFQGYREESKFFVTQCPLKDTVVDFWTMIYDHNSRIIVLLDQVNKNANLWLGKSEMLVVDDFSIMQEEENNVDELEIALEYKKQQDKRIINVFTTSEWQGTALPSTKLMVDLLKSVVSCWNSQKCPITVVCRDGSSKSGLFVALYLILDKMKIDEEVDIFQVVRNIQTRRPEFLKNCDQYEYIYKCVNELLEEETMYANT